MRSRPATAGEQLLAAVRSFPNSAPADNVQGLLGIMGLFAFIGAWLYFTPAWGPAQRTIYAVLSTAGPMMLWATFVQRTHQRASAGLDRPRDERRTDIKRSLVKLWGLTGCLSGLAFIYWLFPEYGLADWPARNFYYSFYIAMKILAPTFALLAVPYFIIVDRRMRDPYDGYWHLGQLMLGRFADRDWTRLREVVAGWLVKGFFLSLMFVFFKNKLGWIEGFVHDNEALFVSALHEPRALVSVWIAWYREHFLEFHAFIISMLYLIDVAFAAVGYAMTFRVFDSHIRSVEPTLLGWAVALMCYQPFWGTVFGRKYIVYSDNHQWTYWLSENDAGIVAVGVVMIALVGIYVWATVGFGLRFSNLTHRGIITHGAYRWFKHPAYVAKNLSWWLISLPFLSMVSPVHALRNSLLLLALNGIYALRAWTEERHLQRDPAYRAYQEFMREHSVFAVVVRQPLGRLLARLRGA